MSRRQVVGGHAIIQGRQPRQVGREPTVDEHQPDGPSPIQGQIFDLLELKAVMAGLRKLEGRLRQRRDIGEPPILVAVGGKTELAEALDGRRPQPVPRRLRVFIQVLLELGEL